MTDVATAPEWISGLTDDVIKADPAIQSFKSVDDLAKSFIETKSLVGKKGVILPGEGAKDEEWGPVFNKLGRPEQPDGYKYQPPAGAKVNEEYIKEFRTKAHAWGWTQKQFNEALNFKINEEMASQKQSAETMAKMQADAETSMRKEWGAKYDEKMATIQKAIKSFGGDLPSDPKAYDPRVVRLIASLSEHLDEATIGNLGIVKGTAMTPEDAKQKIKEIRSDEKHPFNILNHPEHLQAVKEMENFYKMANPGMKLI